MNIQAKLVMSGLLMAVGLCIAGVFLFPVRQYIEKIWWSLPGEKAGNFVIATAAKKWQDYPAWYTQSSVRFEATGTAIEPLLRAEAQWAGTLTNGASDTSTNLGTVDLTGQGQLQVQGITIRPQAKVKYRDATVFVQLTEPVWPVKGFYVLAEKGGKWQIDRKYQSTLSNFFETVITKKNWSKAETVHLKGTVFLKTETTLDPSDTAVFWSEVLPGFAPEPSTLTVWVDPSSGNLRRATLALILHAPSVDDQMYSTEWQKVQMQLEMEFEPTTELSEFVVPPDAQEIDNFWERLKPPIESSLSGEVLGVQLDAYGRPTARPTEVPFLTGWQKKLLEQHGFKVEER